MNLCLCCWPRFCEQTVNISRQTEMVFQWQSRDGEETKAEDCTESRGMKGVSWSWHSPVFIRANKWKSRRQSGLLKTSDESKMQQEIAAKSIQSNQKLMKMQKVQKVQGKMKETAKNKKEGGGACGEWGVPNPPPGRKQQIYQPRFCLPKSETPPSTAWICGAATGTFQTVSWVCSRNRAAMYQY